jgi:hypothetical protein
VKTLKEVQALKRKLKFILKENQVSEWFIVFEEKEIGEMKKRPQGGFTRYIAQIGHQKIITRSKSEIKDLIIDCNLI